MTQLRQKMLEELQDRKITAPALGLVRDLVVRSDSRSFGVAGSSSVRRASGFLQITVSQEPRHQHVRLYPHPPPPPGLLSIRYYQVRVFNRLRGS